jgi:pimeloyl-ACP methyl ester carboxylesterase
MKRIAEKDRSSDSPFSPRNVINSSYWAATHREPAEREDMLLDEVLKSVTGDDGYPGDSTQSPNWPGIAPGTRGILNALAPGYCGWADIVDVNPKPPILWTHGTADIVVADGSAWEMGTLGKMGAVPGWPGEDVFPPQPMVTQIRNVLESYRDKGGQVQFEMFEGSGHGPLFDAAERWSELFFNFLDSAEKGAHAQTMLRKGSGT